MGRRWLQRWLSRPRALLDDPRLDWLGPHLRHPRLWHLGRRTVALGSAIGAGMGILVPIGQIPLAVIAAVVLRANLPTAVLGTFITNWFTFVPVYALAYWLGCRVTGVETFASAARIAQAGGIDEALEALRGMPPPWWTTLLVPFVVGVLVLSSIAAVVTYFGVQGSWAYQVRRAWSRRRARRAP